MTPLRGSPSGSGPFPLSWDIVYARTRQLAVDAGRSSMEVTQSDYERAKRELTGSSDLERQLDILIQNDGK
jgi:hypothetical protein